MADLLVYLAEKATQADAVGVDGRPYLVRFPPINAQHIAGQLSDPVHKIGFVEIVGVLKNGVFVDSGKKKWVALGKHNNRIYEVYVVLQKGWLDVHTAFISNKSHIIRLYENATS